jgi:hypothetical protein
MKNALGSLGATISDGVFGTRQLVTQKFVIQRADPLTSSTSTLAENTIGEGVILQGATSTIVEAEVIGAHDKVFVRPRSRVKHPLFIPDLLFDESFTVEIAEPAEEDIRFDWWIVGAELAMEITGN